MNVVNEFMSMIRFRNTANGNLPHLFYIFCNMEPLGTEFNTFNCYVTGALHYIDIYIGKKVMNNNKYHLHIVST